MSLRTHCRRVLVTGAAASLVLAGTAAATAQPSDPPDGTTPRLEALDRGLVAVVTDDGNFLSWRLLGEEVTDYTADGPQAPEFTVYRDGVAIATVRDSTNYVDVAGGADATYTVAADDGEQSAEVSPAVDGYLELPLQKPADGVTPAGESYTYSANDMSVGDVDGDGQLEYVVKWDPSNSKDVSQVGYTGEVYLDCEIPHQDMILTLSRSE